MVAVNIANALKNAVVKEDGSLNLDGISEIGKFIASFTPVDWLIDLYDLGESILTFDWSWDGTGNILSNGVGFIPWVGNFIKGFKAGRKTVKVVDVAADVTESLNDASKAIRRTDVILDAGKEVKNVGHGAEAFDIVNDAGKALKYVDEGGSGAKQIAGVAEDTTPRRAIDLNLQFFTSETDIANDADKIRKITIIPLLVINWIKFKNGYNF